MEKIQVPAETIETLRAPVAEPASRAAQIAGIGFVLVALPDRICRAVGSFLVDPDVVRVGRAVAFAGSAQGEELKRGVQRP